MRRGVGLRGALGLAASVRSTAVGLSAMGLMAIGLGLATLGLAGCSLDGLLKSDELPPSVTDPAIAETPAGALAAYHGTIAQFRTAFGVQATSAVAIAGALSDELQATTFSGRAEDQRTLPETGNFSYTSKTTYSGLQKVRGQAAQTIGLLTRYRPDEPVLAGHAYALAAYAELFLAELFCSGIPLSTLDYGGDYTYRPGSSTAEVLTHAVALFDTALALGSGNDTVAHLARVGQARAWLGLGDYAAAGMVAAAVPDAYRYTLTFTATADTTANAPNVFAHTTVSPWNFTVSDGEGGNGLHWRASGDPRTPMTNLGTVATPRWHPDRYTVDGASPIVLASGIEARLVAAEAALQANPADGVWLATLNALRTDGTQDGSGTYQPGTGGIAGLAPLTDPGTAAGRVDLLFQERAFWLFLTGHRQGDLRRLVRQYGRSAEQVYPTGIYLGNDVTGTYGTDVAAPIPPSEQILNPRFTGCASRQA